MTTMKVLGVLEELKAQLVAKKAKVQERIKDVEQGRGMTSSGCLFEYGQIYAYNRALDLVINAMTTDHEEER